MKRMTSKILVAGYDRKNPSDQFGKDRILDGQTADNPIRRGMASKKLFFVHFEGEIVPLTNTNIACLAAIARGIDYTYAVTKAYEWKHTTIHNSVLCLQAVHRLIELKSDPSSAKYEPSQWRAHLAKTPYKLTGKGVAAVKMLRESNPFFAECEAWLCAKESGNEER